MCPCRSMGDWLLVEGLRHMALKRLDFDQLGKTHDLQSHEWAVSCEKQILNLFLRVRFSLLTFFNLVDNMASAMELAVRNTIKLRALVALPGVGVVIPCVPIA